MTDRKAALEALDLIADEILHGEGDVCQQILIAYLVTIRDALAAPTDAALHQAHDEIRALRSRLAPTDAELEECAQWCDGIRNDPKAPDYLRDGMSQAARLLRAAPTAAVPQYTYEGDAQSWQLVPQGWKLVPVEPTPDMRLAGGMAEIDSIRLKRPELTRACVGMENAAPIYSAMLAAAPSPTGNEQ